MAYNIILRKLIVTVEGKVEGADTVKATTLLDYERGGVPEPRDFFEENRHLGPSEYRRRLSEAYGQAPTRSQTVKNMVNEAVMMYLLGFKGE